MLGDMAIEGGNFTTAFFKEVGVYIFYFTILSDLKLLHYTRSLYQSHKNAQQAQAVVKFLCSDTLDLHDLIHVKMDYKVYSNIHKLMCA